MAWEPKIVVGGKAEEGVVPVQELNKKFLAHDQAGLLGGLFKIVSHFEYGKSLDSDFDTAITEISTIHTKEVLEKSKQMQLNLTNPEDALNELVAIIEDDENIGKVSQKRGEDILLDIQVKNLLTKKIAMFHFLGVRLGFFKINNLKELYLEFIAKENQPNE